MNISFILKSDFILSKFDSTNPLYFIGIQSLHFIYIVKTIII